MIPLFQAHAKSRWSCGMLLHLHLSMTMSSHHCFNTPSIADSSFLLCPGDYAYPSEPLPAELTRTVPSSSQVRFCCVYHHKNCPISDAASWEVAHSCSAKGTSRVLEPATQGAFLVFHAICKILLSCKYNVMAGLFEHLLVSVCIVCFLTHCRTSGFAHMSICSSWACKMWTAVKFLLMGNGTCAECKLKFLSSDPCCFCVRSRADKQPHSIGRAHAGRAIGLLGRPKSSS